MIIRILLAVSLSMASLAVAAGEVPLLGQERLLHELATESRPLVLDVRTPEEFSAGHVPGAVNIPYDQLPQRLGELGVDRDQEVVVYCRSGRRAEIALDTLGQAGFRRLFHLEGDYQGWAAAQRPLEK